MPDQVPQDISIETPQTLREVGIHLSNLSKSLEELKTLQIKQHQENIIAMKAISESTPSRKEFDDLREKVKEKANKWVENVAIYGGSAIGLALIGAILDLILKK